MANYEDQMDMFETGGLKDEGGSVDPVSGNDVPVGSTQKEVRDDIDAKLSEGEFVLPADVVRYIGLENIMKMRDMAKEGLAKMEAMGQMGNSEEATMDDETDFDADIDSFIESLDEDDEVQEFSVGGLAGQPMTPLTPEQQAAQIYQQTSGVGFLPPGVTAPGVNVNLPTAPVITPGGTGAGGVPTYETKQYIGPNGEIRTFTFINGQAFPPIPEGFTEYDPSKVPEATTGVPTAQVTDSGGDQDQTQQVAVDPVMGAARAFSQINEDSRVASLVDEYGKTQIKGAIGIMASMATGSIPGAIASGVRMARSLSKTKDQIADQMAKTNPTLAATIAATNPISGMTEGQVTDSIRNGVNLGLSPGLATAVTAAGGRVGPPVTDIDPATGIARTGSINISGLQSVEQAVKDTYGNSLAQSNPRAYSDMIEEAAFFDATGYGVMSDIDGRAAAATTPSATRGFDSLATMNMSPTERAALGIGPSITARAPEPMAKDIAEGPSLTQQALDAARAPSRNVTPDSPVGSRSVNPGETVSFQGSDGRTTNVTGKSFSDASGNTRSGGFVDTNNDGVQQSNERSTVTSSNGSTVTDSRGNPVTSRSADEIAAETGTSSSSTDCFMPYTLITMADGSSKEIKDIVEGDEIMGINGTSNKVLGIETHEIKNEDGYWILSQDDKIDPFFTYNHPFFQEGNLVSFRPDINKKVNPWLTELTSAWDYFDSVNQSVAPKGTVLYNLYLDGDYTMYANGIPFHNIVTNGFITMSLYNTGKITQHDLESDVAYTKTIKNPLVRLGYATVAVPLANEVRKNSFVGKCVSAMCTPFVKGISALSNDKPAPFTKLLGYAFVYPAFMIIGALAQAKGKYS